MLVLALAESVVFRAASDRIVETLQLLTTLTVTASGADDEPAKACVAGTIEIIKRICTKNDC